MRVPDSADEAIRDLVRGREDAVRERCNARRLKALLLRNGIAWLATLQQPNGSLATNGQTALRGD